MDESCPITLFIDLFQVDDQGAGIALGVGEDFGAKEGDDMIRDDLSGFVLEISVVDSEVGVEPMDFAGDELSGDEALWR